MLTLDTYLLLPNYIAQSLLNNDSKLDQIVKDVSLKLDQYEDPPPTHTHTYTPQRTVFQLFQAPIILPEKEWPVLDAHKDSFTDGASLFLGMSLAAPGSHSLHRGLRL